MKKLTMPLKFRSENWLRRLRDQNKFKLSKQIILIKMSMNKLLNYCKLRPSFPRPKKMTFKLWPSNLSPNYKSLRILIFQMTPLKTNKIQPDENYGWLFFFSEKWLKNCQLSTKWWKTTRFKKTKKFNNLKRYGVTSELKSTILS